MNKKEIIENEIYIPEIIVVIQNKVHDYYMKYHTEPKYVKMPLWLVQGVKQRMAEIETLNIEYNTGLIKWFNLCVCDTVSIETIEEIEVF